jgi:hypothetical protein
MGMGTETMTTEQTENGTTSEESVEQTNIALLGRGNRLFNVLGSALFPRLAVDASVGPGVTLGGSLVYDAGWGETESKMTVGGTSITDKEELPEVSWFLLHPRVGYVVNDAFALWPRAGITYSQLQFTQESEEIVNGVMTTVTREGTISMTDFTVEFLLAASPVPGAAFVFWSLCRAAPRRRYRVRAGPGRSPGSSAAGHLRVTQYCPGTTTTSRR